MFSIPQSLTFFFSLIGPSYILFCHTVKPLKKSHTFLILLEPPFTPFFGSFLPIFVETFLPIFVGIFLPRFVASFYSLLLGHFNPLFCIFRVVLDAKNHNLTHRCIKMSFEGQKMDFKVCKSDFLLATEALKLCYAALNFIGKIAIDPQTYYEKP